MSRPKPNLIAFALILLAAPIYARKLAAEAAAIPRPLWPAGAPMAQGSGELDRPTLTAFLPATNPTGSAVIIAPGGGYVGLSMGKEGEDVARWLNARGVAGFVLKYRLGPRYHHPVELGDAERAIRTVRAQAKQFGVAPDHIGIWGFSAGGHLAASVGTLYHLAQPGASDAIDRESSRPDFLILAYPVITFDERNAHIGSRTALIGPHPTPALIDELSLEKHVTARTPPTFLFATTDDTVVPVMNSILFYSALAAAGVPAEMHLFENGNHGVGLARALPELRVWPDLLAVWMRVHGFMANSPATAPNPSR